jgi:hypothetical protein
VEIETDPIAPRRRACGPAIMGAIGAMCPCDFDQPFVAEIHWHAEDNEVFIPFVSCPRCGKDFAVLPGEDGRWKDWFS